MKDAQEMSLGPSDPLDAGMREEVKEFPVVEVPTGWGGGRLFGPVHAC